MIDRTTITIERGAFGLDVDVLISPVPAGENLDQSRCEYEAAFQYASNLAALTGWPLIGRVRNDHLSYD